jgi:hypothetical protein
MKRRSTLVMLATGLLFAVICMEPRGAFEYISPIAYAHAVVGRPATPASVAGVARRTTRRTIYRTSMYVASLPPSCTVVVIEGTSLHQCGGTYYQASGSQYVVVKVD